MTLLKTFLLVISIGLTACCGSTKTTEGTANDNMNDNAMQDQKMVEAGFMKGVIVASTKEGDCPYTIKVIENNDYNYELDPINMEKTYMKDGMEVWFKFTGLRMPNRCTKANPVSLTEIQKR
ncbi:hypothetical protein [Constantimarinum furrinae]|uniref:Uncharacterized protein n=1 Tax=Constantimarinum furrinae TaxID=2562285 RepID=A0A7G8PSJ4_9FLAO|nr:hypothetical protein [Constantimarinum furrinae]QNJ97310.1 hypothetical protein ALE3EI_0734 [Constantimarinum furrinae]